MSVIWPNITDEGWKSIEVGCDRKPPCGTPLRTDGHWSVQGLVECCFASGPTMVDIVGGPPLLKSGSVITAPDALKYDGSAHHYRNTSRLISLAEVTLIAIVKPESVDNGSTTEVIGIGSSVSSNPLCMIGKGPTVCPSFRVRDASGTNQEVSLTTIFWNNNKFWTLTGVRSQSKNHMSVYIDGIQRATSTATTMGSVSFNRIAVGGLLRSSFGLGMPCEVKGLFVYNRALSPQEIASISANPYQVCQP